MPEVGGIVHTHSPYATAWAANARAIPCFLTAMADEFGGEIPCGGFAMIGGEEIGREVVRVLSESPQPSDSFRKPRRVHGWQNAAKDALKAAVMCEDVARTSHLAVQLGGVKALGARGHRAACTRRYHESTTGSNALLETHCSRT